VRTALPLRPAGELVAPARAPRDGNGVVRGACHDRSINLGLAYADLVAMTPEDVAGMDERMDAIRLKEILGEPLTEQELMCLQIEQNGFGCHACRNEPPPPSRDGAPSSG
jgi:hypothetical protein